ncbi:ATP-dependent DNA helicase [Candidatus Woesearchaeota archaeon]|nr:ATP-dependent DNA helicase [Candidatus Woesearchaeota archaeon]
MSPEEYKQLLFPFENIREEQDTLLILVSKIIQKQKNLLVHAPTGLGKTVAVLGPALNHALKNNKTVFFLTSRHTQHKIAIETLGLIKEKYNPGFNAVSIIGKKWMCLQSGIRQLYSNEFMEYCRKQIEEKKCDFYNNVKKSNKLTQEARLVQSRIQQLCPIATEKFIEICEQEKMCPYEMSTELAKKSQVIIADYYYIFHPLVGNTFLTKIGKSIADLIIIVDEAHNLPNRLKDLASEYLSNVTLKRSLTEARKYEYSETQEVLEQLIHLLKEISSGLSINTEKLILKQDFVKRIEEFIDYEQLIADLEFIGEEVREKQKQSYIGSVSRFLEAWKGKDEGFARILSLKKGFNEPFIQLSYRCLDPSIVAADTINNSYSTILMSGTLMPTSMYRELLNIENSEEHVFKDPFPKKNRLNLIVPQTTTKFIARSEAQYKEISKVCSQLVEKIPGNTALFFPSYSVLDSVNKYLSTSITKPVFVEDPGMGKSERHSVLEKFKSYKDSGAVLLGVASGSFGEGIDLPGDFLKGVIIVGLPLGPPDLETNELIKYYDKKFSKGWHYGYMFPAMIKCFQNAGRCIRSETDTGVVVFLDKRFVWSNYYNCFPRDWDIKISRDYNKEIPRFFNNILI